MHPVPTFFNRILDNFDMAKTAVKTALKPKRAKFGFAMDLHIGKNPFDETKVSNKKFIALQMEALSQQLYAFKDNGCRYVIFGGDTFDTPYPTQDMLASLLQVLNKYSTYFDYYFILGNHEIESNATNALVALDELTRWVDNITVFLDTGAIETEEGVPLTFLSWPHTQSDNPGLIVMHNEFIGAKRDNGSKFDNGPAFDRALCFLNNQLFVSGHLHSTQVLYKSELTDNAIDAGMVFPGRFGAMRHDGGDFNKYLAVEVAWDKGFKKWTYDLQWFEEPPPWHVRSVRYEDKESFLGDMLWIESNYSARGMARVENVSIVAKIPEGRGYTPTEADIAKYPFVRLEMQKSVTTDTQSVLDAKDEGNHTKAMDNYTVNWINDFAKAKLKAFGRSRFTVLRTRIEK